MSLLDKKCIPCEGGTEPLKREEIEKFKKELKSKWRVIEENSSKGRIKKIFQKFKFPDFKAALAFVNEVGFLAEDESHHPDILLSYGRVLIWLWTHAIEGLSENDFIMARKIEMLYNNYEENIL